jgi:hypothetical protein
VSGGCLIILVRRTAPASVESQLVVTKPLIVNYTFGIGTRNTKPLRPARACWNAVQVFGTPERNQNGPPACGYGHESARACVVRANHQRVLRAFSIAGHGIPAMAEIASRRTPAVVCALQRPVRPPHEMTRGAISSPQTWLITRRMHPRARVNLQDATSTTGRWQVIRPWPLVSDRDPKFP